MSVVYENAFAIPFASPFGPGEEQPLLYAKLPDWTRHASSSPTLLPQLLPSGGPVGGIGNSLRFSLAATSARQRAAYVNTKLGRLRGRGRFAVSLRFAPEAERTSVAVLARWDAGDLDAVDRCYAAELAYLPTGIVCRLRQGPAEEGEIFLEKLLSPDFGFGLEEWMEVALAFEVDSVGSLKLRALARPNGTIPGLPDFGIFDDVWYTIGEVGIPRHRARSVGKVGWQVISRAGDGDVQIGHFRARTDALSSPTLLPDTITL